MNTQALHIKANVFGKIKRTIVPSNITFHNVVATLTHGITDSDNILLQYEDEDCIVTVSCEEDWIAAVQYHLSTSQSLFKLSVIHSNRFMIEYLHKLELRGHHNRSENKYALRVFNNDLECASRALLIAGHH
jgi:hypothetical protein